MAIIQQGKVISTDFKDKKEERTYRISVHREKSRIGFGT